MACNLSKQELILRLREIFSKDPHVIKVELFGSRAREDNTADSDIDLLIQYDGTLKGLDRCYYAGVLPSILGVEVDALEESFLSNKVKRYIEDDKEIIYEKTAN